MYPKFSWGKFFVIALICWHEKDGDTVSGTDASKITND